MCQRNVAVAAALHALLLMLMVPVAPILVAAESFEASPTSPAGVPKGPGKCTTHYYEQTVDHFNWGKPAHANYTYRQRYFVCDEHWKNESGHVGPMFFYFGNEDNVELYLNNTGLMWESAPEFGALLIFAEHRYYGESIPATDSDSGCMNLLTTEQAMADFAKLIVHLKVDLMGDAGAPVVGFGGSYGGMIAAWFRMKFPTVVDGVIAASAPIWSFLGMDPPYDPNAYMETVTVDATPAGGASAHCASNYAIAQPLIVNLTATEKGRALLSKAFRTSCIAGMKGKAQPAWNTLRRHVCLESATQTQKRILHTIYCENARSRVSPGLITLGLLCVHSIIYSKAFPMKRI